VAGPASGRLCDCLAFGAKLIVYGLLSDDAIVLPAARIAFHGISVSGFSRMASLRAMNREKAQLAFDTLIEWRQQGVFKVPVEQEYTVDDVKAAFAHAERESKSAKVIISLSQD
jgi:NADPH:quinone reductase-like Zn-dependent oxidoreductase